jgi:hypothetical protein
LSIVRIPVRTRATCSLLSILLAVAPVVRAVCDAECATPQPVTTADGGTCESHQPTPGEPGGCDHDHSETIATKTSRVDPLVPAQADAGAIAPSPGVAFVAVDVICTSAAAAKSPPPFHQTPLRI